VFVSFFLGFLHFHVIRAQFTNLMTGLNLLIPGLMIVAFSGAILFLTWFLAQRITGLLSVAGRVLDLSWLTSFLKIPINLMMRVVRFVNLGLEGQAGLIWAILLVIVLLSLFNKFGISG